MWNQFAAGGAAGGATPIAGPGDGSAPGGWHPTVLYMLALIVAEIVVVGFLSRHLLR